MMPPRKSPEIYPPQDIQGVKSSADRIKEAAPVGWPRVYRSFFLAHRYMRPDVPLCVRNLEQRSQWIAEAMNAAELELKEAINGVNQRQHGRGRPPRFALRLLFSQLQSVFEEIYDSPFTVTYTQGTKEASGPAIMWVTIILKASSALAEWTKQTPQGIPTWIKKSREHTVQVSLAETVNLAGAELAHLGRPKRGKQTKKA